MTNAGYQIEGADGFGRVQNIEHAMRKNIEEAGVDYDELGEKIREAIGNWCSEKGLYVSRVDIEDLLVRMRAMTMRLADSKPGATS